MSQSLYTAMGGISSATTQLSVISNNVANIDTTAFKASSVEFSDVYSTTLSYGSVASKDTGGTNPIQVGVGVQVSAISTGFGTGSWVATGSDTDLMVEGSGFFTVQAQDGSVYYTRAGDFTFDADGNLVTSDGYKVLGTSSILSSSSSGNTVKVPESIVVDLEGNANISTRSVADLNNTNDPITEGTLTIGLTNATTGSTTNYQITLDNSDVTGSVGNLASKIQSKLDTAAGGDSGVTVSCADGTIKFSIDDTTATSGLKFGAASDTSNFVTQTNISNSTLVAGPGNTGSYTSNILDYTVNISDVTSAAQATSVNSTTINTDGSIEVTYKDGGTLTVQLAPDGQSYQFAYTTKNDVSITGDNCTVSKNVAVPTNFVIQMATITNTEGLVAVGSNLYEAGPNTGNIVYTVAGEMGCGSVQSGGLEASNVDLSKELSNMILAQRAIQANSRIFTTTSNIMDVINQMGR